MQKTKKIFEVKNNSAQPSIKWGKGWEGVVRKQGCSMTGTSHQKALK